MKPRKLHLHAGSIPGICHHFSACGQLFEEVDFRKIAHVLLDAATLVWTPIERQCVKCHATLVHPYPGHGAPDVDYTTCDTHSATPLMRTAVEVLALEWGRFCEAVDETGSHQQRGCFIREGERKCWCGRRSVILGVESWLRVEGLVQVARWQYAMRMRAPSERSSIDRLQREHEDYMASLDRLRRGAPYIP